MPTFGETPTTEEVGGVLFGDILTTDEMPTGVPSAMQAWATTSTPITPNTDLPITWRTVPTPVPAVQNYVPATVVGRYMVFARVSALESSLDYSMDLIISRPGVTTVIASRPLSYPTGAGANAIYMSYETSTVDDKFSVRVLKASGTFASATAGIAIWLVE